METTICAISTGHQAAGIALIRLSGPEAVAIADRVFFGRRKCAEAPDRTLLLGKIKSEKETLDEVLVAVMRGPHSYTGEDVVEINSHGGVLVAQKILALLLENGAMPAEPGEFTKRAFLNGRIDLTKAESVLDIIEAKNEFALKAGNAGLAGKISGKVKALRSKILDECAFIEAALDDPEHYDLDGYAETLQEKIKPLQAELKSLIAHADYGRMMKEGIRTVIAGRPNAGKSSLFNWLTGDEKAIVTDIAGTTRDVLECDVRLGAISLILKDTAGLRNTQDVVEKIGVDKAKEALRDADLILYVVDVTVGITAEDEAALKSFGPIPTILLENKCDLLSGETESHGELQKRNGENEGADSLSGEAKSRGEIGGKRLCRLPLSCTAKVGFDELEKTIVGLFEKGEIAANDEIYITNERQKNLLKQAQQSLLLVSEGIENGATEDLLSIDLTNAYRKLGEVIGESVRDDVIDRVFEKFCMGK